MKIGSVSGVYLNYPIEEAVRRIAAAGYDSIDVWSGRPHVYRHDFAVEELRHLCQLIDEGGLTVSSFLPAFYRYPYSLSSPNGIVRQDSVQYMKECMDNAVELGSPILLVVPGRTIYGQDREDGLKRLADSVDAVCQHAFQYDIKLGVEPANRFVTDLVVTAADAMRVIDELGYANLGVVLDTGHMNLGSETTQEAVQLLGDHLLQLHVNDNDGMQQQNLVPGEGTFNFRELIDTLYQTNFDGVLSAELGYHYTLEPDPAVQLTAQRLRRILQEAQWPFLPKG
jgi:protein FrlC